MARYSPELLAVLRRRYEETDQPMNALAAEFGIGITTLQTLVRKNGWTQRSQRMRHCPPTLRELEEAEAPLALLPDIETSQATPTPTLPLSGGGGDTSPAESAAETQSQASAAAAAHLSPAERLQALVEKEIAAEEATRAALGIRPRSRNEAERCARTIVKLTHAMQTIQKLRGDGGTMAVDDDPPCDIDAFREQLAHRIRAFIMGQIGPERVAMNERLARLTDEQVKELIAFGRQRGMQALLQPEEESVAE
jgi:hypothetical protein